MKVQEELIICPACNEPVQYGCRCEDYFYWDDDEYKRQEWDERWMDETNLVGEK